MQLEYSWVKIQGALHITTEVLTHPYSLLLFSLEPETGNSFYCLLLRVQLPDVSTSLWEKTHKCGNSWENVVVYLIIRSFYLRGKIKKQRCLLVVISLLLHLKSSLRISLSPHCYIFFLQVLNYPCLVSTTYSSAQFISSLFSSPLTSLIFLYHNPLSLLSAVCVLLLFVFLHLCLLLSLLSCSLPHYFLLSAEKLWTIQVVYQGPTQTQNIS